MSEHIKNLIELMEMLQKPKMLSSNEDDYKWVSLSWLKEQINNEIKTIDEQTLSMHEFGARDALRWVIKKLLEG
jgi:rRNA pseudouridine-1189 N-methylase Emg1 (Nep1/Mra1 family)